MNINWYPGHMAKTKKQIIEDLKLIDVVVEILDARIPVASKNPDLEELVKDKKRVVILNKSDLAEENQNQKWIEYYAKVGIKGVLVDSNSGKGIREAIRAIEEVYEQSKKQFEQKGRVGKAIRVIIVGIPNVGKSSFINRISKREAAQVGNRPGVTRQKQWVRIPNTNIELLDTPGVLWPKLDKEEVALNLSYTGAIKDENLELLDLGFFLLKKLILQEPKIIEDRYAIKIEWNKEEDEENQKVLEILQQIGKKRGAILSGGRIDEEKTARILLDDFRSGKLGKITLERK